MKLQTAYDTLAQFLNQYGGGVLEQEALKSMAAYCKGIETKQGNANALQTTPLPPFQAPATPPAPTSVQPTPPVQPSTPKETGKAPATAAANPVQPLPSHSRPVSRRMAKLTPPAAPPGAAPPVFQLVTAGQVIPSRVKARPNTQRPAFTAPGIGVGPLPKGSKIQQQRGRPWTTEEEQQLSQEFYSGMSACDMAAAHKRTVEAIAARLKENLHLIRNRHELVGYDDYRKAIGSPRAESPADSLWSAYEERQLKNEFACGMTGPQIAVSHQRTVGAIAKRLLKLKIIQSADELPGYDEYVQTLRNQGNP